MSVGAAIVTQLSSIVGGRVYANTFPQEPEEPTWPAIRFNVISEIPFADQCGSESTETDDTNVQIDIVAIEYDTMLAIKAAVIAAMATTSPPSIREPGGFEVFDSETKTHRAILEYTFQPSTIIVVASFELDFSVAANSMYIALLMDD